MEDSRYSEEVRQLARDKAKFLFSFVIPDSGDIKFPNKDEYDELWCLDSKIMRFAQEHCVTVNELVTYLEEVHDFVLLEVQGKLAAKNIEDGIEKRVVVKDGEDCSICLQGLNVGDEALLILKCSHAFHQKCMSEWLRRKVNCPLCKYDFNFRHYVDSLSFPFYMR
ncbi:hypothetical protein MKW98_008862 [Papaver atlanticum]|uniref:RING-type domain-containing protein n=1 Tax=Papaver atlanticum TaxID=357466 RepID=A0AAD4T4L3_9MAGN|nr:hypothetical protein MKW98_008862 [Papaver atlanticum]